MTNKKRLSMAVGIGALSLFMAVVLWAAKGQEHKGSEECCPGKGQGKHMMCPMHIKGAAVKVINTDNGVTIHITAEDSKVVKDIQKTAANMKGSKACCPKHFGKTHKGKCKKETVYICPMGDYEGPKTKDGRCPKCGMKLKKDKTQKGGKCKKEKTEKGCKCKQ